MGEYKKNTGKSSVSCTHNFLVVYGDRVLYISQTKSEGRLAWGRRWKYGRVKKQDIAYNTGTLSEN